MNSENKPQITINLSPVLEAWCRWIFKTKENERIINISRWHDVGKHIFSHAVKNEFPVKKDRPIKKGCRLVTFTLPVTDNSYHQLKNNFLSVDDWAEMKINDFIQSEFDLWCKIRFYKGYRWGWTQKKIADVILRGLKLRNNEINYDAIIKNDYRERSKSEDECFKMLAEVD